MEDRGRLLRLAGCVDLDSKLTVCFQQSLHHTYILTDLQVGCAGAVLGYLSRRRAAEFLPRDEAARSAFSIRTIEMFALPDLMFINADALASLQIVQAEAHPNAQMQGPNKSASASKESLSVFGLFYFLAHTPQGKARLRQMFLRPSVDLSVITERLNTISLLLHPDNSTLVATIVKSLKKIKNIQTVVIHLQKGMHSGRASAYNGGIWGSIQQFTVHTLKILEAIRELTKGHAMEISIKVSHNDSVAMRRLCSP